MRTAERHGRVVIVGAGIAGLAAAFFLRELGRSVLVLEGSAKIGGKLAVSPVAGIDVDEGAEALLARRPEGVELIRAAGLAGELVEPGTTASAIWSRGRFHPLPSRQFMGLPADLVEVERSGILSAVGLARARQDAVLAPTARDGDVSVASYAAARFGAELVDRLVDPLLGGVYAGRSDQLSFEATLPGLAEQSRRHAALGDAVRAVLGPAASEQAAGQRRASVFTTLAGGLGTLPAVLARRSGAIVRTGAMVRELTRTHDGWRLTVGPARAPEQIDADAVVLAVPARPAGRLLAGAGPAGAAAAAALAGIEYASMAIVTLAYPATAFGVPLAGSGYLVPAVDGRPVKAVTFSTVKWPHLAGGSAGPSPRADAAASPAGGLHVVRCSVGRIGEEQMLQRDDSELAELAAAELAAATGVAGRPAGSRVTRWGGALPQYTVGHLDRVRLVRQQVAELPGLAVCGAAYDGIGLPACVATARLAAGQVLAHLRDRAAAPPPAAR